MLSVIYKNKDFLVLNKPAGMLVHNSKTNSRFKPITNYQLPITNPTTVVNWLLQNYPEVKDVGDNSSERPGIIHRLDKDTSGVLLVARNQRFFEYAKKLFQEHKIQKTYFALVHGKLIGKGIINQPIGLKNGTIKRTVKAKSMRMVKEAITEYESIKVYKIDDDFVSFVKLTPQTGRTHQLRIHLASIGRSIVGDQLYGKKKNPWNLSRQFLHAESLEFSLENGERLKIEAEMPEDLQEIINSLNTNY